MINEQIAHQIFITDAIESASDFTQYYEDLAVFYATSLSTVEAIDTARELSVITSKITRDLSNKLDEYALANQAVISDITLTEIEAQRQILAKSGRDIGDIDEDSVIRKGLQNTVQHQKSINMIKSWREAVLSQTANTLFSIYNGNETLASGKQALTGTKKAQRKDGIAGSAIRSLEIITRTQATAVQNEAKRQAFKKAKSDGYVYNSILDSNTTSTCRTLHGRKYIWGEGRNPLPPMHYGCRSSIVPYYKDEPNKLAGQNYYTWLKHQPKEVQDEVLGVRLGKAFRNAGLNQAEFRKITTNRYAERRTLAEIIASDKRVRDYLQGNS